MKSKIWFIVIALVLSACGGTSADPTPISSVPDGYVQAPDFPTTMGDLKIGTWFRGFIISEYESSEWLRIKGESNNPWMWGQTLVKVDNQGIWFGKVVKGEAMMANTVKAWQINLEINNMNPNLVSAVKLSNDRWIVVSPDVGVGWDYYWGNTPWNDVAYRQGLTEGMNAYEKAYDAGLAWFRDRGPYQWSIKNGRVMIVDMDFIVVADSNGKFPKGSLVEDRAVYLAQVRDSISNDYGEAPPIATNIPPIVAIPPAVAETGTIPVRFLSAIDGLEYEKLVTPRQLEMLKHGGNDALRVTMELDLPMPKIGWGGKALRILGTGLEWAGYVAIAWMVTDWQWNSTYGPTILNPSVEGLPIDSSNPVAWKQYNWLIANGFEGTAVMQTYRVKLDSLWMDAISTGCHGIQLDSAFIMWENTKTPIGYCAYPNSIVIKNLETEEQIQWQTDATGAWIPIESTSACLSDFVSSSQNGVGQIVVSPFILCIEEGKWLKIGPSWMDQ